MAAIIAFGLAGAGWLAPGAHAAEQAAPEIVVKRYMVEAQQLTGEGELEALLADGVGKAATLEEL